MKKKLFFFFILYVAFTTKVFSSPLQIEIDKGWEFRQARLNNWYPATVPGVVHTDLINNKIIDDPFFRLNERSVQWVDKEDWVYKTSFDLTDSILKENNIDLLFEGLDTYADVYFNGVKIIVADNMFRQWKAGVKNIVKRKGNELKIYFHSPIKTDLPKWEALPYHYEATNDQSENGGLFDRKLSIFARKSGYHYGWDWGPRLVTSGIWRPVFIQAWSDAKIENTYFRQPYVTKKLAKIKNVVELDADESLKDVEVAVSDELTKKIYASKTVDLVKGLNKIALDFDIRNPDLWWCNGLGSPHLYRFNTQLSVKGLVKDKRTDKVGIRSLKLVNKTDRYGKSFYFVLNGDPVFAKGADYVPLDNFLPRVTKNIYKKTVLDAVNANMNMLRVWGGGIYEDDYFYDLCDESGILVWQDFMFACSLYPAKGEFLNNIRLEAVDNVSRLRNHPCIALWCGNNECQDGWYNWGWKSNYEKQNPAYADTIWKQFQDQYYKILPEIIAQYDPGTAYTPSSPFADYGKGSNDHEGDLHYWDVWHGRKPIMEYNKERGRFFSEYGFQSFPEFESVKQFAPEEKDWSITSEVMMSHQRGGTYANQLIEKYMEDNYKVPKDFPSFLYVGQLLQADAVKTAIEAHRRDKGYCWGTLFWQIDDCWPAASWSSRDSYGCWKAAHYFAREAYRDILVSPIEENGNLNVYIVSDRLKEVDGKLSVEVVNLKGGIVNKLEKTVRLAPNVSLKALSESADKLLKGVDRKDVVVHVEFLSDKTYENNYFLEKQKDMNYPKAGMKEEIEPAGSGFTVKLISDKFARGVFLSIPGIDNFFSDNYFDMLPGQIVKVKVNTKLSLSEFEKELKVISLCDVE